MNKKTEIVGQLLELAAELTAAPKKKRPRRKKPPKSVEASNQVINSMRSLLDGETSTIDKPHQFGDKLNAKLKKSVSIPLEQAYQGKAPVQLDTLPLYSREGKGSVTLPVVAYAVMGGTSVNIPVPNVSVKVDWERVDTGYNVSVEVN